LFRSPTASAASEILEGMVGINGLLLPPQIYERLGSVVDALHPFIAISQGGALRDLVFAMLWIGVLLGVALGLPNSMQILSRLEPALGVKERADDSQGVGRWLRWSPSLPWAFFVSLLAAISVAAMGGKSEFLYWQF
jgi:hypothetical protein